MPRQTPPPRSILAGLGQILVGVGMVAIAAGETIAAGRHRPSPDLRPGTGSLADIMRQQPRPRRKPPESGMPLPADPPRGPAPLSGGAAATLDPARD